MLWFRIARWHCWVLLVSVVCCALVVVLECLLLFVEGVMCCCCEMSLLRFVVVFVVGVVGRLYWLLFVCGRCILFCLLALLCVDG